MQSLPPALAPLGAWPQFVTWVALPDKDKPGKLTKLPTHWREPRTIDAHVYTVDIFLWVMAGHGYTLQRSRRPFRFGSLHDFMSAAKKRWDDAAARALGLTPISAKEGE